MSDRMTYDQLEAKIEWEGGLEELLEYGVRDNHVPADLSYSWQALHTKWRSYRLQAEYVMMIIEREVARERARRR